ncbi:hypothetical protein GXW83_00995 [Streptacidiphilus sp. PB12-B1b]|uniref:hypothetical protein n=1 Tax=Streptacidiphilus sp. PB12-B1b TaxID=2705012 RepID=UPI0015FD05C1|nr:hypothetical protein [Streptacidiphilus sp. PB12-B1b]QMU74572.1 hypothetical protein GXW83_00995 [Streptacidiphilus sp. PB12-B1b]
MSPAPDAMTSGAAPVDAGGTGPHPGGAGAGEKPEGSGQGATASGPAQEKPDAAESDTEASDATGGFGQGAFRHNARQDAYSNVGGDFVSGNKYVFFSGNTRRRLGRLSPLLLDRAQHAFVEPNGWPEVLAAFGKRRVVIVRAPDGWGKTTAAIRLLLGHTHDRIFSLGHDTAPAELPQLVDANADQLSGTGLLLDRPARTTGLTAAALHAMEDSLERIDARVVITQVADSGMNDAELLDYVATLDGRPGPSRLVERFLQWQLGTGQAARLLADTKVQQLLEDHLGEETPAKLAADLASALVDEVEAADTELLDLGRVRHRLASRSAEDFEIWIEGLRDPRLHSHAIALAVLNGLPHEQIAAATRQLQRALLRRDDPLAQAPQEEDSPTRGVPDPYGLPLRRRLALLRARTSTAPVRTAVGQVPATSVGYQDPTYPAQIILHTWCEYQVQDVLLGWLGRLAEDPSEQVRIYAGVALGLLACRSFEYLTDHSLRPWAYGGDRNRQNTVAYALSVCVHDEQLRPVVEDLARSWHRDDDPNAQATAARVYGVALGGAAPMAAIDALVRLAPVDSIRVAVAIGDSLTDVLTEHTVLVTVTLMRLHQSLADWQSRPSALLAFLIVAAQLVDTADGEEAATGATTEVQWPGLLRHADLRPESRALLVELWRTALNEPIHHREATQVLRTWAARAGADRPLCEAFLRLVAAVAHDNARTTAIIQRCAAEWAQEAGSPVAACAVEVTARLSGSRAAQKVL